MRFASLLTFTLCAFGQGKVYNSDGFTVTVSRADFLPLPGVAFVVACGPPEEAKEYVHAVVYFSRDSPLLTTLPFAGHGCYSGVAPVSVDDVRYAMIQVDRRERTAR